MLFLGIILAEAYFLLPRVEEMCFPLTQRAAREDRFLLAAGLGGQHCSSDPRTSDTNTRVPILVAACDGSGAPVKVLSCRSHTFLNEAPGRDFLKRLIKQYATVSVFCCIFTKQLSRIYAVFTYIRFPLRFSSEILAF